MRINKQLQAAIRAHAEQAYPAEACGVLISTTVGREYIPCRNRATTARENFQICERDLAAAEDRGDVVAIIHSHPDQAPAPSMADRVSCELHELPWGIVGWPGGDFEWFNPTGFTAPLLGRDFSHGLLDCWSACRDWYAREAGLQLPNFERRDLWWEEEHGPSLYEDNFKDTGFYRVESVQRGDMLVLQIPTPGRPCFHPNHAAIYLGDEPALTSEPAPALGGAGPFIYHHMPGRLASREVYGWSQANRVRLILRHKDYRP
ncbi:C40 family peptidase [Pseudomonas sp. TNT2022 ID357]|uniref:C40 family peptidase n=1 Tax=Pseudomonas idahonensis TaxID=2942628 RepID=A0ABT5Q9Y0_9PSED|nr:Mov34/MPN/PAD-1 family protein [Pseudomonas idahonensis]MDD1150412.1 C40 family peptidase [Pseudomonas idahonensis]